MSKNDIGQVNLRDTERMTKSILVEPTTRFRYTVVVDRMVELYALDKHPTIKNCSEFASHLI